jgi:hypothetical protein
LLSSIHIRNRCEPLQRLTIDHQASQAAFGDWLRKPGLPAYQQSGRGAVDRVAQEAESSISRSATDVIQAPKPDHRIMRDKLSDFERIAIKPMRPNKKRAVA